MIQTYLVLIIGELSGESQWLYGMKKGSKIIQYIIMLLYSTFPKQPFSSKKKL